jgi:hypothetical protein
MGFGAAVLAGITPDNNDTAEIFDAPTSAV